jgi:hypothetical protein
MWVFPVPLPAESFYWLSATLHVIIALAGLFLLCGRRATYALAGLPHRLRRMDQGSDLTAMVAACLIPRARLRARASSSALASALSTWPCTGPYYHPAWSVGSSIVQLLSSACGG